MTGVAALAIFAAFTSCSKGEELFNQDAVNQNKAAQIQESYNQAFLKYIGATSVADIPANQTWGFGGYSTAGTRAENKNLNEWGDPAKNDNNPWDIPPALTERQKLRVRLYFQYNPKLTYKDPELTDFFVQQVYKGNPLTAGPNSPEQYYRVNDQLFVGSSEMDYLFCGEGVSHVNDFNDGEWNNGTPLPVLNTGGDANLYKSDVAVEGVSHLDQITLMVESATPYIGYGASTEEGKKRFDCCALAGAKAIDDWVASTEAQGLGISDFGDPVYDEKWNRSFVGLDYQSMRKEDALSDQSVYALDLAQDGFEYVLYHGAFIKKDDFTNFVLKDKDNNEVKYLSDNVSNMAVGEKMKVDGEVNGQPAKVPVTKSTFDKKDFKSNLEARYNTTINGGNNEIRYYDLDMVLGYIDEGCNPTSTDKNMVKNIGGRDYVYSDWIVTLTEAKRVNVPNPPSDPNDVCIIAEDLSASDATDFDFNDVIFTVTYSDATTAVIEIYCAGGTLPLTVAGQEVHRLFANANPTIEGLGDPDPVTGKYKMINTGAKADYNDLVHPTFTLTNLNKSLRGYDIVIQVNKGTKDAQGVFHDNWMTLQATGGQPAAKLCVGTDFATEKKWCVERQSIKTKYEKFSTWALNNPTLIWWRSAQ